MNLRNAQFRLLFALFAFIVLLVAAPAAYASVPCCQITAINSQTGVVTAKVNATGQVFQFKLNDAAQVRTLKVGQAIYANMTAKQVSLDGKIPAGTILSTKAAPLDGIAGQAIPTAGVRATALPLTGTVKSISSKGLCVVNGNPNWQFKLKDPTLAGFQASLNSDGKLILESRRVPGFGGVSWACSGDWSECWCIKGEDCDSICKTTPACSNPNVPDECKCVGDPGKGLNN